MILTPKRLSILDVLRLGSFGLRTRPLRAILSALGIAIGIAAMLAVVGISSSGQADLQRTLDALGTNLLTVEGARSGQNQQDIQLPESATAMVRRIPPVTNTAALSRLPDGTHVYRHDRIPSLQTNGITVYATDLDLLDTVGVTIASGSWLNKAIAAYPGVVLGSKAAQRLGILAATTEITVHIGAERFAVIGILNPATLASSLDSGAFVGQAAARQYLHGNGRPTTIYLRAADDQVAAVQAVLARTASPEAPYLAVVARPSDALEAKLATERAFNGLLLGLGAVALLVGGVGVANTMVISVLERRAEVGLRRSLGATKTQIWLQFIAEALLLAAGGGVAGVCLGVAVTAGYAAYQAWPLSVPGWAVSTALAATVAVGAMAGLYPAVRAARLSPTEALAAT